MDYIEVLFLLWIVCASCGACAHGGIHGQGCLHGCLIVLLLSAFFVLYAVCGVWRFVSQLEHAQQMAAHESPRTTKLYDRTKDEITIGEVERIQL
jgi:hypothetical protein